MGSIIDMALMVREGKRSKVKRASIFAGRLEALRKAKGYATQADFAHVVGLRQSQISYYEAGAVPKADILVRVALALETNVDYLLGLTDYNGKPHTSDEIELLARYHGGDWRGLIQMLAPRLKQALDSDPSLLEDTSDESHTLREGE